MAKILVVGLNPAWQQVFALPALNPGAVHRASAFHALASGKGINAAKVLSRLGHEVSVLQIVAGETGRRVRAASAAWGVRSLDVETSGETRVCTTLLHDGKATEIIGPFSVADETMAERLLALVSAQAGFEAVLVCGAAPAGLPPDLHTAIVLRVAAPLVVWDSVSGLTDDVLSRVTWLKVNTGEHAALAPCLRGRNLNLLVTDGPDSATLRMGASSWKCTPPRVNDAVNPIGAGDTATAVLADALLRGLDARAAAGRALAAASASCRNVLPAEWDAQDAARMEQEILWSAA